MCLPLNLEQLYAKAMPELKAFDKAVISVDDMELPAILRCVSQKFVKRIGYSPILHQTWFNCRMNSFIRSGSRLWFDLMPSGC